jgi:CDP-paratose 2-epimerase
MKILVTGGSGYLGTHVRSFFNADDFSRRSGRNILNDADAEVVADYDVVIHLAAHLDKDPAAAELSFRTNVDGTANLIRNLHPNAVFIYASTKDVYGAHANEYKEIPETCSTNFTGQTALEWSKLVGERYVEYYARRQKVRACIFRMSTTYGRPSEGNESGFVTHYVESVKRRWPIRVPLAGKCIRDILHVDDFSRACQAFIDSAKAFGLYNLGGGSENAASLREMIDTVSRLIQVAPEVIEDDNLPPPVPLNYVSDLRRIQQELGWRPQIGIEEGLRSLV